MEKSRAIGAREIRSAELVRAPALRHACRKGAEPSHKSKMEDLTVEVCGENGAYYKVRSVKSIAKSGRRFRAVDSLSREPRYSCNLAMREPVLRECTALKCSRCNAASFDAMSRLTGRDFSWVRVVAHPRARYRREASKASLAISQIHDTRTRKRSWLPSPRSPSTSSPVFPLHSDESRFYIRLTRAPRYTPDDFYKRRLTTCFVCNFFPGLCHRCLWRRSFGNFREWVSFLLDSPRLTRACLFCNLQFHLLFQQQYTASARALLNTFVFTLSLLNDLSILCYLRLTCFLLWNIKNSHHRQIHNFIPHFLYGTIYYYYNIFCIHWYFQYLLPTIWYSLTVQNS